MDTRPLLVVGHMNPDTDSVCAAISYARYLNDVRGTNAHAFRAGNLNAQTEYVLTRFGAESPPLLVDVYPKIKDIMIGESDLITVSPDECISQIRTIILDNRFSFLPVANPDGVCLGKVTTLRLADTPRIIREIAAGKPVRFSLEQLLTACSGYMAGKSQWGSARPRRTTARRITAGTDKQGWVNGTLRFWREGGLSEGENPAVLVIDEQSLDSILEAGTEASLELLPGEMVLVHSCANPKATAQRFFSALSLPVAVVKTDLVRTVVEISLSMPAEEFMEETGPAFAPTDLVREAERHINRYNEGGFLVLDQNGVLRGVVTRVSFLTQARFQVVMVDHNEFSQAVTGMESAEVVEIIDHHRIGTRTTDLPITFINRVVGSTCTIIADMYRNDGIQPDSQTAGLLLSALLSDTVILSSPTTTQIDREIAEWLAPIAGVDAQSYGREMFAAGSALTERSAEELVRQDQKFYTENGTSFTVSQIEVVGYAAVHDRTEELATALSSLVRESGSRFGCLMVTDITKGSSLLLCEGDPQIIHAISYPAVRPRTFELRGVLSRKKQVVPYLVDLIRNL